MRAVIQRVAKASVSGMPSVHKHFILVATMVPAHPRLHLSYLMHPKLVNSLKLKFVCRSTKFLV